MGFLFRKLRFENIKYAKSYNYFKYAIGEIILVVFGILIALQVNNWNEDRKSNRREILLLKNVLGSLERDSILIEDIDSKITSIQYLNKSIENYLVSNITEDSITKLEYIRRALVFSPVTKINHPELSNEVNHLDLKNTIRAYYQSIDNLQFTITHFNEFQETVLRPALREGFAHNYSFSYNDEIKTPQNVENLINKEKFLELIKDPKFQQILFEWKVKAMAIGFVLDSIKIENLEFQKEVVKILQP